MINYIYDGTFEGLLTVIGEAVQHQESVNDISSGGEMQIDLFADIKEVRTDPELAAGVFKRLRKTISREMLMDIAYCFLSEEQGIEKAILDYIRLLFTAGPGVTGNFLDETVYKIERVSGKVAHEIDRLHGFIRFRKLAGGIYYAPIEPDHNVVQFLAPHFKARFADQNWLIHDLKRKTGIYYDGKQCVFLPEMEAVPELTPGNTRMNSLSGVSSTFTPDKVSNLLDKDELAFQHLWDQYFKQIAIKERRNKRLQRQRMPARYWRCLVEAVSEDN